MTMFSKLKQIKDLRSQAKTLQNQLAEETVHADAQGGKIHIVMDGNQKIVSLEIDPSLLSPEKKREIEEGIKEVVAAAVKEVQQIMVKKMRASGMSLPGMG
ncbi:MAG: YbaB/EbfC family nucleoid-associated protein [bacterium]